MAKAHITGNLRDDCDPLTILLPTKSALHPRTTRATGQAVGQIQIAPSCGQTNPHDTIEPVTGDADTEPEAYEQDDLAQTGESAWSFHTDPENVARLATGRVSAKQQSPAHGKPQHQKAKIPTKSAARGKATATGTQKKSMNPRRKGSPATSSELSASLSSSSSSSSLLLSYTDSGVAHRLTAVKGGKRRGKAIRREYRQPKALAVREAIVRNIRYKSKAPFDYKDFNEMDTLHPDSLSRINYRELANLLSNNIEREIEENKCPTKGPHKQRLQIYQESFDRIIDSLPSYAHVLLDIKRAYDQSCIRAESKLIVEQQKRHEYEHLIQKRGPNFLLKTREEVKKLVHINDTLLKTCERYKSKLKASKEGNEIPFVAPTPSGDDSSLKAVHEEVFFLQKALVTLKQEQKKNYVPNNVVKWLESSLFDLQYEMQRINQTIDERIQEYNVLIEKFAILKMNVSVIQEEIDASDSNMPPRRMSSTHSQVAEPMHRKSISLRRSVRLVPESE